MNVKELLTALAPTAARMLGGPLAEMAVTEIGKAIGIDAPTAEKIGQVITDGKLSAEQLVAMRQADAALQSKLAELGVKLEEIEAEDRKDARAMQIATRSRTPEVLSWIIVAATLFLEGWVLIYGVPTGAPDVVVGRVLGTLDVAFITVLTFWLGTAHQVQGTRSADTRRS